MKLTISLFLVIIAQTVYSQDLLSRFFTDTSAFPFIPFSNINPHADSIIRQTGTRYYSYNDTAMCAIEMWGSNYFLYRSKEGINYHYGLKNGKPWLYKQVWNDKTDETIDNVYFDSIVNPNKSDQKNYIEKLLSKRSSIDKLFKKYSIVKFQSTDDTEIWDEMYFYNSNKVVKEEGVGEFNLHGEISKGVWKAQGDYIICEFPKK